MQNSKFQWGCRTGCRLFWYGPLTHRHGSSILPRWQNHGSHQSLWKSIKYNMASEPTSVFLEWPLWQWPGTEQRFWWKKHIFYMSVLEIEIASMGVWTGGRFSRIGLVAHVHDSRLDHWLSNQGFHLCAWEIRIVSKVSGPVVDCSGMAPWHIAMAEVFALGGKTMVPIKVCGNQ